MSVKSENIGLRCSAQKGLGDTSEDDELDYLIVTENFFRADRFIDEVPESDFPELYLGK